MAKPATFDAGGLSVPDLICHELTHPDGRRVWVFGREPGPWSAAALAADASATPRDRQTLHRRLDRLTGQWVAVSPSRNRRPDAAAAPASTGCPLCPGGPELPSSYEAAVFENRYPTFAADAPSMAGEPWAAGSLGACEVIVYTDAHDGSFASLPVADVLRVVELWRHRSAARWAALGGEPGYVMAFENRGAAVGATLSHPHGQLYALPFIPPRIDLKMAAAQRHRAAEGSCLACAVVSDDLSGERLVASSPGWVAAVPYAARWPYEIHVRARRHGIGRLADLSPTERVELALLLHDAVRRLDALFGFELASMLTVLEAPAGAADWHLHVELAPPQRNATSLKLRASVETALDVFINDALPEQAAAALRATLGE